MRAKITKEIVKMLSKLSERHLKMIHRIIKKLVS